MEEHFSLLITYYLRTSFLVYVYCPVLQPRVGGSILVHQLWTESLAGQLVCSVHLRQLHMLTTHQCSFGLFCLFTPVEFIVFTFVTAFSLTSC